MKLKLSEAIRQGATLKPQAWGLMFERVDNKVCSCALGAAYDALRHARGVMDDDEALLDLYTTSTTELLAQEWPELWREFDLDGEVHMLQEHIIMLNDDWDKSREEIADWVAGLGL